MNQKTFKKMYSKEEIKAIANDSVVTPKTGCRRMWTEEEIKAIAGGGGGGGGGDTTTVKNLLDNTKSCYSLFNSYKGTSIDGLITYDDTSNVTNMAFMFNNCTNLTTIPQLDTSNVNTMSSMFYMCKKLTTVPALNVSNVTNMSNMFMRCNRLKSILMTGMKVDFDISDSTTFERTDLVTILNNLATVTTTQKLKMGTTNLAKLTDEDKAIATNKGWTLA